MNHGPLIVLVTLAATGIYTMVGQMVPQKEVWPPKPIDTSKLESLDAEQLAAVGKTIFEPGGKGKCSECHYAGSRFPNLLNIGAEAGTRKPGYSDVDYISESIYEPNAFIVPGQNPGMPVINKPPIGLNDKEIKAVIAYIQSRGGTPTVTIATKLKYESAAGSAPAEEAGAPHAPRTPAQILSDFACATCHNLDKPDKLAGPSLFDVGQRLSKAEIYESILEPDAKIAAGFAPGMMAPMLKGGGFYDKVRAGELQALVEFLAAKKGK